MTILDKGRLMARAGEHICCANGHPNFLLVADIRAGDLVRSAVLQPVAGMPAQVEGAAMSLCHVCGAMQVRWGPTGVKQVNIDGEWRGDGVYLSERVN